MGMITSSRTSRPATPDRNQRIARWMKPLAWASLAANIAIVVSGGVVRLTGSGLGCPTWPRCTDESFVPHGELGIHGVIEFGNRLITFLIAAIAIATFFAARSTGRRSLVQITFILAIGVPAQAVIGGISVLTDLNPWVVSLHLLVSMAMIGVAVLLLRRVDEPDSPAAPSVHEGVLWLVRMTFVVGWIVLYIGTVVTGSGPHAGDVDAPRNGLDPRSMSQLHTDFVMILLGLVVALVLVGRAIQASDGVRRAARWLLIVILAQGLVGFVQYYTDLPIALVALHLLGAAATSAALTWLLLSVRERTSEGARESVSG